MAALAVIVVLGLLMWVLLIRPQRRRQLIQNNLLSSLEPGDEVVTAGGIYGVIESVEVAEVLLEIAPGTTVRIAKKAIAGVVEEEEVDEDDEEPDELEADAEPAALEADSEPSTAEQRS